MNGNNTEILNFTPQNGLTRMDGGTVTRAALFGDGVFETMVFGKGQIRFAKEHGERISTGLRLLKIIPSGLTIHHIQEYIKKNFPQEAALRIRWNAYRDGLGKYTPLDDHAQDLVLIQAFDKPPKIKNKAYISQQIRISPSPWSHCKTLNALPYVMANIERKELGMDEVILLDDKGFVSEAGSANIFWMKENVFYTPSLSCNCIAGVARRKIIAALEEADIQVIEGEFSTKALLEAERIFTSNVTGVAYIANLEGLSYETRPVPMLERLFD